MTESEKKHWETLHTIIDDLEHFASQKDMHAELMLSNHFNAMLSHNPYNGAGHHAWALSHLKAAAFWLKEVGM